MRVLYVTSECFPFVKTGGLGDVSGALPAALAGLGVDVRLLMPGYPAVLDRLDAVRTVRNELDLPGGIDGRLLIGRTAEGVAVFAIDAPQFYDRPGNPYVDRDGRDWPDNHLRFGALCWVAAGLAEDPGDDGWTPDIIHGHDWQAGLTPAYLALRSGVRPATMQTIHNLAYQGLFPADRLAELRLPSEQFRIDGFEYYGKIGFLKAGLFYADRLTTVSPTYAVEIQDAEQGYGLEGLLAGRSKDLVGIINGVDYTIWNPATDSHLVQSYDLRRLDAKAANKAALQARYGLTERPDAPLFGVVSRLTLQKGLDLVLGAVPRLVGEGAQLVVLGTGDLPLERDFRGMADAYPGSIGVQIGYDEALSHLIQGGADVIVVPSRSEPCGLTQLYGLKYGTLPLVRRTGGLADSVVDASQSALDDGSATGFVFGPATAEAFTDAAVRTLALYRQPDRWQQVQRTGMTTDFSWQRSAERYLGLYRTMGQ